VEAFAGRGKYHQDETVAVDRAMVARTVQELRSALPEADDLLAGLLGVAEATRTVLEVDGAALTLIHADGPPRWVAATDAAMELLAQVQHDFGEGPYLQAYAQDRAVMVQDLGAAPVWVRLAAVVGRLRVLAVVSVPIRLAAQPVGTLDLYRSQPRAWTTHELEGAGEFAAVAGELVHNGVALAAQRLEVAQLRQALTSRVWIEQAKGSWPPPRASTPRWPSSCCGPGPGRPRARWPRSPKRLSRTPNASGWPPWPWTMPGSGRPRAGPRPPSRPWRPPRPT
jgi:GAF domain-containing protein